MHFPDLSPYVYLLKTPVPDVLNVGWLDAEHVFPVGDVSEAFLSRLEAIIESRIPFDAHVNRMRGIHDCSLGSCGEVRLRTGAFLGTSEIWIPGATGTYLAGPSLVLHYVREHRYLPPREFIDAVERVDLTAPFVAQETYLALVRGHF